MNIKFAALALTIAYMSMLAACNTVEGVGKDVERGGEKVQQKAKDSK